MRNISEKRIVEKLKQTKNPIKFLPENYNICDIMRKNKVEADGSQAQKRCALHTE
jgi:hypothetical protein